MKATGGIVLILLIAAAIYMSLSAKQAEESFIALGNTGDNLREGVTAVDFDREQATRDLELLRVMTEQPSLVSSRTDSLREIAQRAAGWAESAPTGSAELSFAAALREATGELREYASTSDSRRLDRAKSAVADATDALVGQAPVGQLEGIRDRLGNLEQGQREIIQDAEDAINQ